MLANLMALITEGADRSEEEGTTGRNSGRASGLTSRARLALAVIATAVLGHAQAAVVLRRSVRRRHADAGPGGTRPPSLRVHRVPVLPATVRPGGRRRASGQPRADRGSDGTLPARGPGRRRAPAPTEAARRLGRHADGRARVRGATAVEGCTPADQCCFLSHTRYAVTAETWSSLIS